MTVQFKFVSRPLKYPHDDHHRALKKSFKAQMLEARELAITASVNRLLAEKGFDAMTVDEVAAEVGIAKASLYKHFNSKEELACAAMVQAMQKAQAFLEELHAQSSMSEGQSAGKALNKLKATTRWTLELKLAGQMPTLPSHNSSFACQPDGQSTLHGRVDERERLAGLLDLCRRKKRATSIQPCRPLLCCTPCMPVHVIQWWSSSR
jgi:TetR/AcrR family transcriptional regulator, regulator of autoinduction and epiphytic fitness